MNHYSSITSTDGPTLTRERVLWAALVGLAISDAMTTVVGLSLGLHEANPVVASLLSAIGVAAAPISQLVFLAIAAAIVLAVDSEARELVLIAGIVPSALIVVNNLIWITIVVAGWSA